MSNVFVVTHWEGRDQVVEQFATPTQALDRRHGLLVRSNSLDKISLVPICVYTAEEFEAETKLRRDRANN